MWRMIFLGLLGVALVGLAYIRLAPSDPARWHQAIEARSSETLAGGAVRVVPGGAAELQKLVTAMQGVERTQFLAGSVEEGRVTFVTRSRVFGFPDYTTLEASDGRVRAFARLRFGQSDLGVNANRLERVFAAAGL
ncbi:MAG: DUF1499 domain-containing protein [Roseobacter sp.]